MKKSVLLLLMLVVCVSVDARKKREVTFAPDSTSKNIFTLSGDFLFRGEYRDGGVAQDDEAKDYAAFLLTRVMLKLEYEHKWFSMRVTPRFSGIWGQGNNGTFSLFEGWVQAKSSKGLFAKIGRQELSYDDERIIGSDDWTMMASSHDVVKLGYDGPCHKVHAIVGFNQNPTAADFKGGTTYIDGSQPYKTVQVLWYHYQPRKIPFGVSALFMNVGMQSALEEGPRNYYQQLTGGFMGYHGNFFEAELSGYYQFGRDEHSIPISAWMASCKFTGTPTKYFKIIAGYDYLSGDKNFAVPQHGAIGLTRHTINRGFSPLFGSHHEFYGAMDFFYIQNYIGGFSPGLQNAYISLNAFPIEDLRLTANYHYMATGTEMSSHNLKMTLGHEIEVEAAWKFASFGSLSAGYTYMNGTETMNRLRRGNGDNHLHWVWLSLRFYPRFLNIGW